MRIRCCMTEVKSWLHTQCKIRTVRISSFFGLGMGIALSIFTLVYLTQGDSEPQGVGWRFLEPIIDGLSWIFLEIPVEIITSLICRPEPTYDCVDGYGILYSLFIGLPLMVLSVIFLSGLVGMVAGGLLGLLLKNISRKMKRQE